MFFLRRPSSDALARVLAAARDATPTFANVGATKSPGRVPGYSFNSFSGAIGHGQADWDAACDGLRAWAAHAGAGVSITPPTAPIEEGTTVVAQTSVGPMHVLIPCRVVYVVDEADRYGFAYATLPGHPEDGEESFIVSRDSDGAITFTVSAHSRHAELLAKLGAPVSRFVQRKTNKAYVSGLAAYVDRQRR